MMFYSYYEIWHFGVDIKAGCSELDQYFNSAIIDLKLSIIYKRFPLITFAIFQWSKIVFVTHFLRIFDPIP